MANFNVTGTARSRQCIHLTTKFQVCHFSNSFFRPCSNNTEIIFCLNMFILIGKYLAFFWKNYLSIHSFGDKMQKFAF